MQMEVDLEDNEEDTHTQRKKYRESGFARREKRKEKAVVVVR